MFDSIDFSQWPWWAGLIFLVLNFLKTPLGNLFPTIFGFLNAKAVASAEIAEIAAEGRRQDEVAEKLMLANLVQTLLDQNRELISFNNTRIMTQLNQLDKLDIIISSLNNIQQVLDRWVKQ